MTRRALRCVRAVSRAVEGLSALLATLEERLVERVETLDVYSAPEAARAAEEMRDASRACGDYYSDCQCAGCVARERVYLRAFAAQKRPFSARPS